MEENLQENKYIVFVKQIWPTIARMINIVLYTIFNFLKNSVSYIISQIKNS
jgi:hypothetical protein